MIKQFDDVALLRLAYQTAYLESDDPDTRNGGVLVVRKGASIQLVAGVNRLPDGVVWTEERVSRDGGKYFFMEHAERDTIFNAWRSGIDTEGATLVVPWAACADCARVIAAAGIGTLVTHKAMMDKTPDRWQASVIAGDEILADAGVQRVNYVGEIGRCTGLFDGEHWYP